MAQTRQPTMLWALFGFDGRISREVYWLGNFGCGFLAIALTLPTINELTGQIVMAPWSPLIAPPFVWAGIALAVKRLHDRGLTGLFALALLVPLLNILATFIIGVIPGDRGANRFGPATNSRTPR